MFCIFFHILGEKLQRYVVHFFHLHGGKNEIFFSSDKNESCAEYTVHPCFLSFNIT